MKTRTLLRALVVMICAAGALVIPNVASADTIVINGSIVAADPDQARRVVRDNVESTCLAAKSYPGTTGSVRNFDAHTFTNTSAAAQCVTVTLGASCDAQAIAYSPSFNPTDVSQNWLADSGTSTGPGGSVPIHFSFMIGAGQQFVVTVNPFNIAGTCASYTLTVSGTGVQAGQVGAALTATKTDAPDPVNVGQNLTYTIQVANAAGASAATSLAVRDDLPAGTVFVPMLSSAGCTLVAPPSATSGGTVSCDRPNLAAGATDTVTIVVNVTAAAAGQTLTNFAKAYSAQGESNTAIATTAVGAAAGLSVTKTAAPATVTQGRDITYTVTVSNAGPSTAANVVLTDVLPPGVALRTPLPPGCTAVNGTITCTIGTLGAGASRAFTFVVRTETAGTKTNTATVTSTTFDPNPADNTATATTTVTPDLTDPICRVVSLGANQVVVVAQDVDTGLASITPIPPTTNVVVSGNTGFTPGTQAQVTVTGTRINRTRAFALQLRVTDVAGNDVTCDPVLATLRVTRADRPTVRSYAGIPRVEHKVTIKALRPGLTRAVISVNGQRFVVNLRGKRIARLSIASALTHARNNTVTIKLYGARGAMALVALTD